MKALFVELLAVGAIVACLIGVVAMSPEESPATVDHSRDHWLQPLPLERAKTYWERCGQRAPQ